MTTSAVVLVIISVILTASVAFLGWLAQTVYNLHSTVAVIQNQQNVNTLALRDLQEHGSPVVREVLAEIRNLKEGQARIEQSIKDHGEATK